MVSKKTYYIKNILRNQIFTFSLSFVTAHHPKDDGRLYFQSVHISGGGVPGLRFFRGVPRSQIFLGGSQIQVSDLGGGPRSQIFFGGVPGLRFFRGGPRSHIFLGGPRSQIFGGVPVSVKGKNFDTRFGLIYVQTGKKIFCRGTPTPVKGKIFDTRFGLIHVQTGKKKFCRESPPLPQ